MTPSAETMRDMAAGYYRFRIVGKAAAEFQPTFFVFDGDGDVSAFVATWTDDRQKVAAVAMLKREFRRIGVVAYGFACEAWTAMQHQIGPGLTPSQSDHRREVLFAVGVDKRGRSAGSWTIERGPGGGVAELVPQAADLFGRGRFDDLL